jgi:hypothetical protein
MPWTATVGGWFCARCDGATEYEAERFLEGGTLDAANPDAGRGFTASARGRRGAELKDKVIESSLENAFASMQMTNLHAMQGTAANLRAQATFLEQQLNSEPVM